MFEAGKNHIARGGLIFTLFVIILNIPFVTSCTGRTIIESPAQIPPTTKSEISNPATITPTHTPTPEIYPTQTTTLAITDTPAFGIGSTTVSEKDGMVMVYVPAGEFQMGSEDGEEDEKPVHSVYLDAFWIDQTEVTNAMYAICVEAGVCNPPRSIGSFSRVSYYGDSEFENYPVIHVSWNDAKGYCEWADRRLPTEAEWEKAARWNEDSQTQSIYPWGDMIDESYANYNHNIGDTTAVGSYEKGISFYGAYDMAGNVSEWLADWINVYPGGDKNASSYFGQSYRLLRGGSFQGNDFSVRSAGRGSNNPVRTDNDFGFRCARNVTP